MVNTLGFEPALAQVKFLGESTNYGLAVQISILTEAYLGFSGSVLTWDLDGAII